ncbi:MAG: type VII secretion protein EssC [Eubacteriales bacterium]
MNKEFSRQPRFLPEIPRGELEVPNPPSEYQKPEISWFTLLGPPLVMLIITVCIIFLTDYKSPFIILSISTTIMTLIGSIMRASSQIKKYKKKKKEREKKYLQFIADTKSDLSIAKEQQIKAMNDMNPEPSECIQRLLRTDNKLWERTPSYNDFLSLRVGVGSVPLSMHIKYTKQAIIMETDPLLMEPQRLALEFEKVSNVPVNIDLMESEICGVAGEEEKTSEIIKLMLLQIITHHGYDDVRIVIISSEKNLPKYNWLRFLPHIWDDDFETRYLMCGKAITHQTLAEIYDILKERDLKSIGGSALPHYIFFVEDVRLLENEPINKYLFNKSKGIGVSTVFIAQNSAYLPMNCRTIISLQGRSGEMADREAGGKAIFTPDTPDFKNLELAARKISCLRIKNSSADFTLPKAITLMKMLKAKKVTDIDIHSLWTKNKTYKGMSVPIGAKPGGALFNLDMHETGCGPHGLVAGTTGSGKSELLQSIIISLAINYHPHDIAFVLIDYKGGGMADVFEGMPHLVGTITNLGGNQTTRALLSIKSELLRRQRVFSEYGVNNIDKYQKLYYKKKDSKMPAIPHLIMIADEFAELKQDQPEFMKELVSTARVGRSLGVHLILATQKPAGVVDEQIWSNSKFKICLKVQDERDSKDVIKRPDAAMIKEPGRAYIQVGNDEVFELFQSAYSGADYDPDGEMKKSDNRPKRIYDIALNGKLEQLYPLEEEKIPKKELDSQLKTMVDYIIQTSKRNNIEALDGPWMPPLPETLYLDEFFEKKGKLNKTNELLSVPIGIVDDPRGQRQEPLKINFANEGNLFVYGASGSGKTYLLRTLCLSLSHSYTPLEVNYYIMDFGGTALKVLNKLPHCGGVMTLEQEKTINQFVLFLFRSMDERKKLFEKKGCEGFNDYRRTGEQLQAIVLIIDNYFALSETYETIAEKMILLAREGLKYGIYLVATATNASLVRYKLTVNFKMAISLQLIDKGEYNDIVGRTEGLEPTNVPGCGLVREKPPLEFQTALPEFKDASIEEIIKEVEKNEENQAVPIPVMPSRIDINKINKKENLLAIGLGDTDLQPLHIDLYKTPIIMVAGEPMSGKSTIMMSWIRILKEAEIYVLDSSSMGLFNVMEMPNVTDLSKTDNDFADKIKETLDNRRQQLIECKKSNGNVEELAKTWKQIIIAIDQLNEFTQSDKYTLKDLIERIVKQERGMKVAVIVGDNTSDLYGNWDGLAKAIKEEQTGVLIGSIKDQSLYSTKIPYGAQEKELEQGDGYLIVKNKYAGLRLAISNEY